MPALMATMSGGPVCANAADETVQSAIAEGKKTGIKVVADTIGVKDQVARARQCVEWGIDMLYLHFAADQRRAHPTEDGVQWVADVCGVAGDVPVGLGCFGVDDAVPETIEASLQLSEAVLSDIGVPMGLVIASIHERRDEFREILRKKNPKRNPDRAVFQARRRVGKASPSAVSEQATQVDT